MRGVKGKGGLWAEEFGGVSGSEQGWEGYVKYTFCTD